VRARRRRVGDGDEKIQPCSARHARTLHPLCVLICACFAPCNAINGDIAFCSHHDINLVMLNRLLEFLIQLSKRNFGGGPNKKYQDYLQVQFKVVKKILDSLVSANLPKISN
jgi:hypothetical protein